MKNRTTLFYLCASGVCVALIAVCSILSISMGEVKFTLQLAAVLLVAGILPTPYACGTVAAYILLGVIGVPVFAGFTSGFAAVAGPTGGFILGFLPTVFCAAVWLRFIKKRTVVRTAGVFAAATLICYICGVAGFCIYMPEKGIIYALYACVLPYVGFDAVKIIAAAFLTERLAPEILPAGARKD